MYCINIFYVIIFNKYILCKGGGNMEGKDAIKKLQNQYKRQNNYIKDNFDRMSIVLPKGTKERIKELTGKSCNAYISALVIADLERLENGCKEIKEPDECPF